MFPSGGRGTSAPARERGREISHKIGKKSLPVLELEVRSKARIADP